jgi:ABC-type multidrug transport system ATPase subunit
MKGMIVNMENKRIAISIKNVSKSYENKVVNNNLQLDIFKGEIFCLAGPNGSGKTTLIKQIMGLEKPDNGSIYIDGLDVKNNIESISYKISYQPQNVSSMLRGLKVREAIYYIGRLKKLEKQKCKTEVDRLISLFQISYISDCIIGSLSGGEKQLVNLCMTFIGANSILVFDEPTNNLDVEKKEIFMNEILRYKKMYNSTILIITHDLIEFEKVIDRISILYKGNILVTKSPSTLCLELNDLIKIMLKNAPKELRDKLNNQDYHIYEEKEYHYLITSKDDFNNVFILTKPYLNKGVELSLSSINLQDKYFNIISNKGELKNV